MPRDEVEQAIITFYKDDPFYPCPRRDNLEDLTCWNEFKEQSLEASEAMLDQGMPEARLPALWVDLVEQRSQLLIPVS